MAAVTVVDLKQTPVQSNVVETLSFPLEDSADGLEGVVETLAGLLGEIDVRLRGGRDVHVVCALGQSRSVTVVTNYMAAVLGVSFGEALGLVRNVYPPAGPNPGFYETSVREAETIGARVKRLPVAEDALFEWHRSKAVAAPARQNGRA